MPFTLENDLLAAKQSEAATRETLFAAARCLQDAASAKSTFPSRFLLEGARTMARHLDLPERRMHELIPAMAFWQIFLPSALARDTAYFTECPDRWPWSFQQVRASLDAMESHPQLVVAAFHMAALPLVAKLVGAAWAEIHPGPRHLLLATRNLSWLRLESGRWVLDSANIIGTDRGDLRRLIRGLRNASIQRLLILVDGPHRPGLPGTHALSSISPTLGFKTGLLSSIISMKIPVLFLAHFWEPDGLVLRWHPLSRSTGNQTAAECISTVAMLIEDLLRNHPEQWLNWTAASLRT